MHGMRRSLAAAGLAVFMAGPVIDPASAQAGAAPQSGTLSEADRKAVLEPLDLMFDGMKARDTTMIMSAFVPGARLVDIRNRDGQTTVRFLPVADFARSLLGAPAGDLIERYWDTQIDVEDNVASVWVQYDFHIGDRFTHCGIDAFHLAKTHMGWKIVQVMDTRRTTGCSTPPAK